LLVLIGREIVFPAEDDLEGALKVEGEALECPPVLPFITGQAMNVISIFLPSCAGPDAERMDV